MSTSNESVIDEVEQFLRDLNESPNNVNLQPPHEPPEVAAIATDCSLREILADSPEQLSSPQAAVAEPTVEATDTIWYASEQPDALERALISYITSVNPARLFFAHEASVWRDFYAGNGGENANNFGDRTPQQLSAKFCGQLLPRVFALGGELSAHEKRCFELFDMHPEYERCAQGWRRVSSEARVASEHVARAQQDFRLVQQPEEEPPPICDAEENAYNQEIQLDSERASARPSHTLVHNEAFTPRNVGYNFKFSKQTAALLSAALSTDYELSDCTLLEPEEIHARLRAAKLNFEQKAEMPINCGDASKLCEKLVKLTQLREAIWKILKKKFA